MEVDSGSIANWWNGEGVWAVRRENNRLLCRTSDGEEFWVDRKKIVEESEVWHEGDVGRLVLEGDDVQ